jgi:hypothetical protein
VAVDPAGNIVAAGAADGTDYRFAVARYLGTDGTLDTLFGGGDGKVTTDFTNGDDFATDVAIDQNFNIVAVGRAGGFGGRFAAARYLSLLF